VKKERFLQGFEALPNVAVELRSIQDIYGGTMLLNEDYLLNRVREELADNVYSIVHIASHGQFAGDVNNTFVLTYDDKLTMNRLEQFMGLSQYRNQPIELLTLSACQTATGDDRAALGLAGIAVKAGARSALASLWFIEDRSTARLISEFYRELKNPALSKAQALQQAQLTLINEPEDDYQRHPSYWGPFLLIGNWL
jgi:CHAT domain-containing protein